MILVDANLLLYAEDRSSPYHSRSRQWWDDQLSGSTPVGLCWTVLLAFVRIGTNQHVFERPLTIDEAVERVQSWLDQPCVRLLHATHRHWEVLRQLLVEAQAVGNLVTDAHLAALSVEHGCELCSTDTDFSRFPHVKWQNPVAGSP